jgi:hypothetical protein
MTAEEAREHRRLAREIRRIDKKEYWADEIRRFQCGNYSPRTLGGLIDAVYVMPLSLPIRVWLWQSRGRL